MSARGPSPSTQAAIRKYYAMKNASAKKPSKGKVARKYGRIVGKTVGQIAAPLITAYDPSLAPLAKYSPIVGEVLGGMGGTLFNKITGMGRYTIKKNTLMYPEQIAPSFGEDSIRVKKREFITLIDASTSFSNNVFNINPGLSSTFPWLSNIASNYEQYRFNGLIFQLISTSGDTTSSTNLGLGSVAMCTDYDAADSPFSTMVQGLGASYSNCIKPSEDAIHGVECAPDSLPQKLYYVRSTANPSNTDIRLYDLGVFQVLVDRCPANYTGMMQLWCSYDVTLVKSHVGAQQGTNISTDQYYITGVSAADPFSAAAATRNKRPYSTLGLILSNNKIEFPDWIGNGTFLVVYRVWGLSIGVLIPTITFDKCTRLQSFLNNTVVDITNSGTSTGSMIMAFIVKVTSSGASFTLTGGTYPTTSPVADLVVTQVNGDMY